MADPGETGVAEGLGRGPDWRLGRRRRPDGLAVAMSMAVILLLAAGMPLWADEADYCIKCSGPGQAPDKTYVCRIRAEGGSAQGRQLYCIMNIARDNGHDSCAARSMAGGCEGTLVTYAISGGLPAAPAAPAPAIPAGLPSASRPDEEKQHHSAQKPPRTLIEFSKQAARDTSKGFRKLGRNTQKGFRKLGRNTAKAIKKTGRKITRFTKKLGNNISKATRTTFNCLTSLFSNCTSD